MEQVQELPISGIMNSMEQSFLKSWQSLMWSRYSLFYV